MSDEVMSERDKPNKLVLFDRNDMDKEFQTGFDEGHISANDEWRAFAKAALNSSNPHAAIINALEKGPVAACSALALQPQEPVKSATKGFDATALAADVYGRLNRK
jgi:hypothetical protein